MLGRSARDGSFRSRPPVPAKPAMACDLILELSLLSHIHSSLLSVVWHDDPAMIFLSRRLLIGATFALAVLFLLLTHPTAHRPLAPFRRVRHASRSTWRARPQRHPVSTFAPLPDGPVQPIPRIQHAFPPEAPDARRVREDRQRAVRDAFAHAWHGYRTRAWLQVSIAARLHSSQEG